MKPVIMLDDSALVEVLQHLTLQRGLNQSLGCLLYVHSVKNGNQIQINIII